eukprot:Gb_13292 [translate_table: standard]
MATVTLPPTIPHPSQDCQQLRDAFKGFSLGRMGTDERKIIDIFAHRRAEHRQEICQMYYMMYKEDLKQRVKLELTRKLEKAMLWWVLDPAERDVQLAREALQGWNPNSRVIIEISCCRTSEELLNVRRAYHVMFKKSLEEDIAWETNGGIQKLLVALATAYRYSGPEVDMNLAKNEAQQLYEAGEGRAGGIEEDTYVRILGTRSFPQLNATFECFKQTYGHDINKGIKNEYTGEFEEAIRMIVKCINRPTRYFAKVLFFSMKGLGVDDDSLTRIIVTRAEIDMQQIKLEFLQKYQKLLDHMIKNETIGNHRSFLLKLIGSKVDL